MSRCSDKCDRWTVVNTRAPTNCMVNITSIHWVIYVRLFIQTWCTHFKNCVFQSAWGRSVFGCACHCAPLQPPFFPCNPCVVRRMESHGSHKFLDWKHTQRYTKILVAFLDSFYPRARTDLKLRDKLEAFPLQNVSTERVGYRNRLRRCSLQMFQRPSHADMFETNFLKNFPCTSVEARKASLPIVWKLLWKWVYLLNIG